LRHYKDSQEYQRDRLRGAINQKYPHKDDGTSYDFSITATYPDEKVVVVHDWRTEKYYEIPYTIENGEVTLGELTETDHDELYITKAQIEAKLTAARSMDKPVGIGWSPGIHSLFINGKPSRLLVPKETIQPTFELLRDKLSESRVPLGIDHLDEQILNENKILAKMNPLDVGEVKQVATDGRDIYITDSLLTNPSVQELHDKGELPSFSIVGPVNVHECERDDIDYVLDSFKDIERIDFVEQGGCQTCKTGIEPTELILASKLSMEVDNLTNENKVVEKLKKQLKDNPDQLDFTPDEIKELKQLGESDETVKGLLDESKLITEETPDSGSDELDEGVKSYIDEKFEKIETLLTGKAEDAKVEARLAKLEQKGEEQVLKAKKAVINGKIDNKIKEGTVKPVQRELLLQAGLSMKEEDFDKHLATFTEKVVDLDQHAHLEASAPEGAPSMEDLRASRKSGGY
jgi:hypothetical protein